MSEVIIDVRERDEYAIGHVANSINVPLSIFSMVAPGVLTQLSGRKIVFMCRGGIRAAQAKTIASGLGFNNEHKYTVYEGGILQWIKNGNRVVKGNSKTVLPLQRQVQLIIGFLVIFFGVLGMLANPWYSMVAAAVGAELFIAGVTGYCLMAQIVGWMPWNKSASEQCSTCTPCGHISK